MKIGMEWRGDDTCTLEQNLGIASSYYQEKYGQIPNECWIHGNPNDKRIKVKGMSVRKAANIRPHYLWMGRKGE